MGALDCVSENMNETLELNLNLETLVLEAKKIALKHNVNFVATEHFLLALLSHEKQFILWTKLLCASKIYYVIRTLYSHGHS